LHRLSHLAIIMLGSQRLICGKAIRISKFMTSTNRNGTIPLTISPIGTSLSTSFKTKILNPIGGQHLAFRILSRAIRALSSRPRRSFKPGLRPSASTSLNPTLSRYSLRPCAQLQVEPYAPSRGTFFHLFAWLTSLFCMQTQLIDYISIPQIPNSGSYPATDGCDKNRH